MNLGWPSDTVVPEDGSELFDPVSTTQVLRLRVWAALLVHVGMKTEPRLCVRWESTLASLLVSAQILNV